MKGMFFQQPLEYRIGVEGDEWQQGDALECVLSVKNRSASSQPLGNLYLHLACGSAKKVKQKADDAFEIISSAQLGFVDQIEPDAQSSFPWTFQLDKNCVISEKSQSLYLVCGKGEMADAVGHLAVTVEPHEHIQAVLSLLENSYSFVLKGQKSKKGWVEAKLKAPSGKAFATLDQLTLSSCFEGDELVLNYCFHTKGIAAVGSNVGIKKSKRVIEQRLNSSQYLFPGGLIHYEPLEAAIGEVLEANKSKF